MSLSRVAALYVSKRSVYKNMDGVDAYDCQRDARDYYGPHPVVAHPPCALWGRLSHMATPRIEVARYLAYHAVEVVLAFGGAIEHPAHSQLFKAAGLPEAGCTSNLGCTIAVKHTWFDGPLDKPTWLFAANLWPDELPDVPYSLREPTHLVDTSRRSGRTKKLASKSMRNATPLAMARWLVEAARRSGLQRTDHSNHYLSEF